MTEEIWVRGTAGILALNSAGLAGRRPDESGAHTCGGVGDETETSATQPRDG